MTLSSSVRIDRPPQAGEHDRRTSRGKMMGLDQNKGLEWAGAPAAFYIYRLTISYGH